MSYASETSLKKKVDFSFEGLQVWQEAVAFAEKVIDATESMNLERKHYRLIEQIEAASTSVAMNIAEGKGRYSKKEFIQYLYIARGSLFETVTLLHIFSNKKWISSDSLEQLRAHADKIGKMISSLINSLRESFAT